MSSELSVKTLVGPFKYDRDAINADRLWLNIKVAARQDPCLSDMIEELLVYYLLRYGDQNGR